MLLLLTLSVDLTCESVLIFIIVIVLTQLHFLTHMSAEEEGLETAECLKLAERNRICNYNTLYFIKTKGIESTTKQILVSMVYPI